MKSSIFLLTLATVINYAGCNPLPEEIFQLEARNGPYCHVLQNDTPCRKGAGSAYSNKRAVDKSENAGGVCKAYDTYKYVILGGLGWGLLISLSLSIEKKKIK